MCCGVGDELAVRKTGNERKATAEHKASDVHRGSSERRSAESPRFVRQTAYTSSARPSTTTRNVAQSLNRSFDIRSQQQYGFQQAMLLQATMRMHRNPLLFARPAPITLAQPIPSDWTTVGNLRASRRPDARVCREEKSYVVPAATDNDNDNSKSRTQTLALPVPDGQVQVPLPALDSAPEQEVQLPLREQGVTSTVEELSSSPSVPVRQSRNRRRPRATVVNDSLTNGILASNDSEKPPPVDFSTSPSADVSTRESEVKSSLSVSSTWQQRHNVTSTTTSRPSLVFEKVHNQDTPEPVISIPCRITERRLPLHESSV